MDNGAATQRGAEGRRLRCEAAAVRSPLPRLVFFHMEVDMRHLTRPAAILVVPIVLASCGEASPPTASLADGIQARAEAVPSDISVDILAACDARAVDGAVGSAPCPRP